MTYGAKQYKQTSVTTASRGQILIMLYEAAIRDVKKASECIDKSDIPGKAKFIGKAHDIINELAVTLDFKVGGDIARELERLYNFMVGQLIKANVENNKECLKTVEKLMGTLLEGWRAAVDKFEKEVNKNKQMELLRFLKNKNKCLNRFLEVSENFLKQAARSDFTELTTFHAERESILKLITHLDQKIEFEAARVDPDRHIGLVDHVRKEMDRKQKIVKSILQIDAEIMRFIEEERSKVKDQIFATQKAKENLSKFKSEWIPPSGEGLDTKL